MEYVWATKAEAGAFDICFGSVLSLGAESCQCDSRNVFLGLSPL